MLRRVSVLVVDDSGSVRTYVTKVLREHLNCHDVVQAKTADEAWALIQNGRKVDWVISDWEMPGMTGDEFLLKIRQNPKTSAIPFMIMTARQDRDSFITAAQAGVSDYLLKPFSADVLIQKIRKVFLSCERRLLERFKATTTAPVKLVFPDGKPMLASLVDISEGGLLTRVPHTSGGPRLTIYDCADITISAPVGEIHGRGELIRVERDRDNPENRNFVMLAFEFQQVEGENRKILAKLLENLRSELPSAVG
ncbi:MAG: response regulator [Nitrospinae bacterium]|nr:response regulator [Nitrospinota bacterium]